jgi:hypothetical protein
MDRLCLAVGLSGLRVLGFSPDPWLRERDVATA